MSPNPNVFYEHGATHAGLAELLGMHPSSLSTAICNGHLPFKRYRVKVGRHYVYDVDACIAAMKQRQDPTGN